MGGEHSTTTTKLDAPLLRLMLSLASAQDSTWSSIDITSAFLNADVHEDDTVLVTPILVKMNTVKPNTVWHVKKAIYGLREAPRLWQGERDQQLRELQFLAQDKPAHLVPSHIQPSLWFIVEGPPAQYSWISPLDHSLRSLVNQMEYIVDVLMKFEPSLQLKTRTTPGNQGSFAAKPKSVPKQPAAEEQAEYLDALHALIQDDIVEIDAAQKSPKLHYNSEQNVITLPSTVGCLSWIALRTRPDIAWATSRTDRNT